MWCHCHCQVEVWVEDGRLQKIEENKDYPNAELLRRVVRSCPRSRAAAEWFYHTDRLKYPLKRMGERGEGKWETIGWEQALDEIAGKLGEIREGYGAEAVATSSGTGRTDDEYRVRFFNLLGSPNHVGQGNICFGPDVVLSAALSGWSAGNPGRTSRATRCVMYFGANPEQESRRQWLILLESLNAGAKLIVVDPRRTATAERADLWLQIRPGTDPALYMSLINVIINEGLYDKEFVQKWCYGFDELAHRAQDYPPEKVSEITWVPAEKIREAARMYAANKPAAIFVMMGVEHLPNSIEALHARYILTAITGNFDVKGGEPLELPHPKLRSAFEIELNALLPPEQRQKQIGAERFKLMALPGWWLIQEHAKYKLSKMHTSFASAPLVYRAAITGEPYPIKAMITLSSNPMVTQANTKLVYKALKSLDLYVVVDFWMTPSAELADYVLPAASWLERPTVANVSNTIGFITGGEEPMPPQVDGQYERRTDYDFWRGLGIRLGQEEYWPWKTLEEAYDYRLEPLGYTLKGFLTEKGGFERVPPEERKYEKQGFGTPTGKFELYSTILEKLGYDPLPHYEEPPESPFSAPELAQDYPLILITGARHQPFYHSEHRQIDSLRQQHPEPIMQLHPKTAVELGIADGDWAWIETPRGRIRQRCHYFEGISPRVVHAQHGWWLPELPGEEPWLHGVWESNINVVTDDDPEHCNKIGGGWPLRAELCKVYKAKEYR
jgi:anaerobic selenocysteine-containing dehydrogenase